MSFEPREYLLHILVEADYLLEASQGLTFSDFDTDELKQQITAALEP